jgi:hypothetical protein
MIAAAGTRSLGLRCRFLQRFIVWRVEIFPVPVKTRSAFPITPPRNVNSNPRTTSHFLPFVE